MNETDKRKRLLELQKERGRIDSEIIDLEYQLSSSKNADYTGRVYTSGGKFLKVLDGKKDNCLVLEFYIQDNLFDSCNIPKNNEFTMTADVYHSRKEFLSTWKRVNHLDENYLCDIEKVKHYTLEHFSNC